MNEEQGIQVIEQALNLANVKGAFKLEESSTIFTALTVVKNALQKQVEGKEEVKVKK